MVDFKVTTKRVKDGEVISTFTKICESRFDAEQYSDFMIELYLDSPKDYDYEVEITEVISVKRRA